jgi:Tfp pilus assembly protein PilX
MNTRVQLSLPNFARQRGAAALLVVLILLIAMAMLAVTTMRSGMVEQQITGNDMRAREAFEGSDAGIEYGLAYLTNNSNFSNYKALPWATSDSSQSWQLASNNIVSGNFSYTPNITYQRMQDSDYINILSTATETHDHTITAVNEQYVKVQPILNGGSSFNAPPLGIDGCLTNVHGGPDIYTGTYPHGIAVGTSHGPADQGTWSNDKNSQASFIFSSSAFGNQKRDDDDNDKENKGDDDKNNGNGNGDDDHEVLCLVQGNLNAHGGQPAGALFTPGRAWEYVFGNFTREQIKAKADAEVANDIADSDRSFIWVTATENYNNHDWGSATHPVILVFDKVAKCPSIHSSTIYGVVFIDHPCTANGWGGATVYGAVIVNGNISGLNANTAIYDWSVTPNTANSLGDSIIDGIYKVPGTWKDF